MSRTTKSIRLSTGVTLPYVEQGDASGVPVLMLHGYSDSSLSFEPMLAHLPDSVHAYALTMRGHGDADKPEGGYRQEDYAADVIAFMDAVGIDAAVITGHSGGSYMAQRVARDHPERVLGIVLIASFQGFRDNPAIPELHAAVEQLTDPVDREFVREFQESCVAQPVPAAFMDAIVDNSARMPARVWRAYLEGLLETDVPTASGTIAVPTLLMWGDQDAFVARSDQDALLAAIPESRLRTYRGVGHCPQWEQPERAAKDVATFANQAAPALV